MPFTLSVAPVLYHTWEQQLLAFHRKEVLHPKEERNNDFLKLSVLRKRLAANGFDITQLPTWPRIDQLRLVANTAKHADGDSADILKAQRPEFFEPRHANGRLTARPFRFSPRVYRPMSGEDLFLTMADIEAYGRATIEFWGEFAEALERAQGVSEALETLPTKNSSRSNTPEHAARPTPLCWTQCNI
jgi:hypothetical protein